MDSITHGIAGAAIGRLGFNEKLGGWETLAGAVFGLFPDTDYILTFFGERTYLAYHRSFTNSLVFLIPFALSLAFFFTKVSRERRWFWTFFSLAMLELLFHDVLDLMTSFGTMLFYPLSTHRYSTDTLFIIDLVVTGLFVAPLVLSYVYKKHHKVILRTAFFLFIVYAGTCEFYHTRAVALARNFALLSGLPFHGVAALPQPFSPFRWSNLVETDTEMYQGFVDFAKKPGRMEKDLPSGFWQRFNAQYRPSARMHYMVWRKIDDSPWAEKAMNLESARFFYRLARFPVVRSYGVVNGHHMVEFIDLRFRMVEGLHPLTYQVEFDDTGKVVREGFTQM